MIYVLLSNDYEVFLGGNRLDEARVLCDPTERLLDALDEAGAPMTFFCDVACLWRYRETGRNGFVDTVEHQLQNMIRRGHDVQAHIHPHWLTAGITQRDASGTIYDNDLARFGLAGSAAAAGTETADHAAELGRRARGYLEGLLQPIDPAYRCLSYRAGGYSIQPGSREIFAGLRRVGYLIDSSIVPGMRLETSVNRIDFTSLPGPANGWREGAGPVAASEGAGLFEIPVAAHRVGSWALGLATARRILRRSAEAPTTGWGIQQTGGPVDVAAFANKVSAVARRVLCGWDMLELCGDPEHMMRITDRFIKEHAGEDPLLFSFSCHSKTVDGAKLDALVAYLSMLRDAYGTRMELTTFARVPGLLGLDAEARRADTR